MRRPNEARGGEWSKTIESGDTGLAVVELSRCRQRSKRALPTGRRERDGCRLPLCSCRCAGSLVGELRLSCLAERAGRADFLMGVRNGMGEEEGIRGWEYEEDGAVLPGRTRP